MSLSRPLIAPSSPLTIKLGHTQNLLVVDFQQIQKPFLCRKFDLLLLQGIIHLEELCGLPSYVIEGVSGVIPPKLDQLKQ